MSALPPYSVRVSQRAKRLHLKILPPGKVEVVVPKRVSLKRIPGFVAEHRQWIKRHLDRMVIDYPAGPLLPETVHLPGIDECWRVDFATGLPGRVMCQGDGILKLRAADEREAAQTLQRWLQRRAKTILPPLLAQVSEETGLPFSKVTVRAQKSRWGSCSSRGHISLNRALLFVSPAAVRYLLIHELCHTRHMNHSPRYWALVARLMPEYREMEAELRCAMLAIPRWALPGFGE
jgi:predicted metal-dependent hydrolase